MIFSRSLVLKLTIPRLPKASNLNPEAQKKTHQKRTGFRYFDLVVSGALSVQIAYLFDHRPLLVNVETTWKIVGWSKISWSNKHCNNMVNLCYFECLYCLISISEMVCQKKGRYVNTACDSGNVNLVVSHTIQKKFFFVLLRFQSSDLPCNITLFSNFQ